MVFSKDHLTFSHTLITENYIESIIEKYNTANFPELLIIKQEPAVMALIENGIIKDGNSENRTSTSYRAGLLQKFSPKETFFKTHEGELLLKINNSLNSEKFSFTVTDSEVISQLDNLQGENMEKNYLFI